ncbi:MAG: hypothetical protein AB7F43_07495 [Bacteriovoracia bacterium]
MSVRAIISFLILSLGLPVASFASKAVQPHGGGYSAGGYILAKPRKASIRGIVFKRLNLEIGVGGLVVNVATESQDVFEKFRALDSTKNYVFEYVYPSDIRPKFADSHIIVTDIHEVSDNQYAVAGAEVRDLDGRNGYKSEGTAEGTIIAVERWTGVTRIFDTVCNVFVVGQNGFDGIQQQGPQFDEDGQLIKFNPNHVLYEKFDGYSVYEERACRFAENALKSAKVVEVDYTEDFVEYWDILKFGAKAIRIVK